MDDTIGRRRLLGMGAALVTGVTAATVTTACRPAATPAATWASGGTSAMRAKASYPDPFASAASSASSLCKVTCELTEGPCYSSQAEAREDISYGQAGLPMRLCFRVLDESCAPVAGALVDVWHVSPAGKYSGNDAEHEDVGFCTGEDPAYSAKLYFRGKQTTDAAGKVAFDTCFPGWYHGRTVHVHLTISVKNERFVTTQVCFDDALVDDIVASHPDYGGRGTRDSRNTTDGVFDPKTYGDYLVTTARMSDGAMLASKTLQLRRSTQEPVCEGGGRRFGGPPGPPPGFDPSRPPPIHRRPPFPPSTP
jgi:protocatechuate 3,4-dioxygenase beta subunit